MTKQVPAILSWLALGFGCASPAANLREPAPRAVAASYRPADEPLDLGGWERFRSDLRKAPAGIWEDTMGFVFKPRNLLALVGTWVVAEGLDKAGVEDWVQREIRLRDNLDPKPSDFLNLVGDGAVLMAASGAIYGYGLAHDSEHDYVAGKAALSSLTTTGLITLAAKIGFGDERPNGGSGGFPSGHSSMAMAFANSLRQSYGWRVGVPLYLLTGAIAFQRLDSGAHELDDVIVGLTLGYLVSSQVTKKRTPTIFGGELSLYREPEAGRTGLTLSWGF